MIDAASFPHPIRDDLLTALEKSWGDLGRPGTWWRGAERVAIAAVARSERQQRGLASWLRAAPSELPGELPEAAIEAARRIAADAPNLDREWTASIVSRLGPDQGDARYVEIASVVVTVSAVDAFCEALGVPFLPLPQPHTGEPARERPEGTGKIGAWVPAQLDYEGPNVGRALSLVPPGVRTFFRLVSVMYAGKDFREMIWENRPLARPQVELLAARVSAVNECFY